jgi:hypothetical protein
MAIKLETNIKRFNGISSDDKPDSPPEGSTFHMVDTGEKYIYHNGMWEEDLRLIYALNLV